MSQLNNEENNIENKENIQDEISKNENEKVKKEKSKHPTRNMIIIILIFTAICVGVTTFLIIKNKSNNSTSETPIQKSSSNNEKNVKQVSDDGLGLKSLNETYKRNNLMINHSQESEGPLYEDLYNPRHKLEIDSIRISCLKNTDIQDKINSEIQDAINNMKEQINDVGDYKYADITAMCTANFADTLSIVITGNCYDGNTTKYFNPVFLNYALATGEKIEFNDLFTSSAAVKSILSKSAYDSAIASPGNIFYHSENTLDSDPVFAGDEDYNSTTYGEEPSSNEDVEAIVFKFLNDYNNGENLKFCFTPRTICVENKYNDSEYIGDRIVVIPIKDYYNQIAIYNRFKSEQDLYEGYSDYIPNDNIPVLLPSNGSGIEFDILYPGGPIEMKYMNIIKVSDNLTCYVHIRDTNETLRETMNKMLGKINSTINEYKSKNDEKCRFVIISVSKDVFEVEEYTYGGANKDGFINGIIGYFQDGPWDFNQNYHIENNNLDGSAWKNILDDLSSISYSEKSEYRDDNGNWIDKEQYLNNRRNNNTNTNSNTMTNSITNNTTNTISNSVNNNTVNNTNNNIENNVSNNNIEDNVIENNITE